MNTNLSIVDSAAGNRTLLDRVLFQMAMAADRDLAAKGRGPLAAAMVILESRDHRTDVYACSNKQIAKQGAMDKSTAKRAVQALIDQGWFVKISGGRTKGGVKVPNLYIPQWPRAG